MAVPKYFAFFPVILQVLSDGQKKAVRLIREEAIAKLHVSQEDCKELLPSGKQRTVDNRINWAITYLKKAGLVAAVRRGVYEITAEGCKAFAEAGDALDLAWLERYESFRQFIGTDEGVPAEVCAGEARQEDTPQDILDKAYNKINDALSEELLAAVMERSPRFFEELVVELLLKMGYGSAMDSSGRVVGKSGDEGIDGIVREDKLGFSNIYIQTKRWDPETMTVGRPEIQKFVGALAGKGATKGLFITTAQFSKEAISYANNQLVAKIVLVDGRQLTRLMIEYGVGVSDQFTYTIKRIDSDYFEDAVN